MYTPNQLDQATFSGAATGKTLDHKPLPVVVLPPEFEGGGGFRQIQFPNRQPRAAPIRDFGTLRKRSQGSP